MSQSKYEAIGALYAALHRCDAEVPEALIPICCGVIEANRTGPLPLTQGVAEDAEFWAGLESPLVMEAYLMAISRHLPETPTHQRARKRIVAAMFLSLPAEDKERFIAWAQTQKEET